MGRLALGPVRQFAVACLLGLPACTGAGKTWVYQAADHGEPTTNAGPRPVVAAGSGAGAREPAPFAERRVITLGSRSDAVAEAPAPASASSAPNIVVQVNVTPTQWGSGVGPYGSVGYPAWGWGYPGYPDHPHRPHEPCDRPGESDRPDPSGPPAPPSVGGDWPAPPSYGPSPLSHTVPANPWR